MKHSCSCLILLLFTCSLSAQTDLPFTEKANGVFAEFYALRADFSEGFVSLNYERQLGKRQGLLLRLGLYPDFASALSVPVTVSWLTAPLGTHHFEGGAGLVYRVEAFNGRVLHDIPAFVIPLMYRYQKQQGLFFRGGVNLFVSFPSIISPSASVGYQF